MRSNAAVRAIGWLVGGGLVAATTWLAVRTWRRWRGSGCPALTGGSFAGFQYSVLGNSPTIFLHGRGGSDLAFAQKVDHEGFYVRGPIVVGRGYAWTKSEANLPSFGFQLEDVAHALVPFVTAIGRCYGKPLIAGHSQGGAVALLLATKHPDLVRGAVVASTTLPRSKQERFVVPVTVLHGADDQTVKLDVVEEMVNATGATLEVIEEAGHELAGPLLEAFQSALG